MTFVPASRDWTTERYPTKASVTYTVGAMIYSDNTDNVPVVDATQNNVKGILKESKASGTTTTSVSVLVPLSNSSTFFGDMESGESLTAANVGDSFDFATGSGDNLGVTISTATTYDTVTLVKFLSASKGVFKLNQTYGVEN